MGKKYDLKFRLPVCSQHLQQDFLSHGTGRGNEHNKSNLDCNYHFSID